MAPKRPTPKEVSPHKNTRSSKVQLSPSKDGGSGSGSEPEQPPTAKRSSKRAVDEHIVAAGDAKRAKKKGVEVEASKKKALFERIFQPEDEVIILTGMLDYSKNGSDPGADADTFYPFIKKKLAHVDFTRAQLLAKMKKMRYKYEKNARKGDRTFSKAVEQESYDLSKNLWGKDVTKSNGKAEKTPNGASDSVWINKSIASSGLDEGFMREGLGLIDDAKKSELEGKWRELMLDETEIYLRRNVLVQEQTRLVLDAFKKQ